ncbi:MAG: hypothetical protein S4CHLAM45_04330 [Chlamydiales bacterium]|nr:hypothetical protein [Chlamydiales bacterium]MCH9622549.1 hypothetical protein [Chlamydiales bacterium]
MAVNFKFQKRFKLVAVGSVLGGIFESLLLLCHQMLGNLSSMNVATACMKLKNAKLEVMDEGSLN